MDEKGLAEQRKMREVLGNWHGTGVELQKEQHVRRPESKRTREHLVN